MYNLLLSFIIIFVVHSFNYYYLTDSTLIYIITILKHDCLVRSLQYNLLIFLLLRIYPKVTNFSHLDLKSNQSWPLNCIPLATCVALKSRLTESLPKITIFRTTRSSTNRRSVDEKFFAFEKKNQGLGKQSLSSDTDTHSSKFKCLSRQTRFGPNDNEIADEGALLGFVRRQPWRLLRFARTGDLYTERALRKRRHLFKSAAKRLRRVAVGRVRVIGLRLLGPCV